MSLSVQSVVRKLEDAFAPLSQSPAFDARELVARALGLEGQSDVLRVAQQEFPEKALDELKKMTQERLSGRPLQYILGEWEFYSLPFFVGEGVLIPRPDTETLVDVALMYLKKIRRPRVLDLCAGSGCIAVSIAHSRPDAEVTAVELSPDAFAYLLRNIDRHHAGVRAVQADVLAGPDDEVGTGYDLILSNPPYLRTQEMEHLSAEVRCEPYLALEGGADGLNFYRALVRLWSKILRPGGRMAVEIGYTQAAQVRQLMEERFVEVEVVQDLAGRDRVVCAHLQ